MNRPSFFSTFVLLAFVACTAFAATSEGTLSEWDELDLINASPECKNTESAKCQARLLTYYCKYAGNSRNAVQCSGGRRRLVEAQLNATYVQTLANLRIAAKEEENWANAPKLLVQAQRAWIKFREEECALVSETYNRGTLQPAVAEDCMREEAELRIQKLKEISAMYPISH